MSWDDIKDPSPDFVHQVLEIVRTIPSGRVMTYGDIADALHAHPDLAEVPGSLGARLVGQVMARSGDDVPWWRVIRATGQPPKFHEDRAWDSYVAEGTPLTGERENYKIDLQRARYQPGTDSGTQAALDLF